MYRFISPIFSNLEVMFDGKSLKFVDFEYFTNDKEEVEFLKKTFDFTKLESQKNQKEEKEEKLEELQVSEEVAEVVVEEVKDEEKVGKKFKTKFK